MPETPGAETPDSPTMETPEMVWDKLHVVLVVFFGVGEREGIGTNIKAIISSARSCLVVATGKVCEGFKCFLKQLVSVSVGRDAELGDHLCVKFLSSSNHWAVAEWLKC